VFAFAFYLAQGVAVNVSDAGRRFIEGQEGCALGAYWDVNGYSIGFGHHSPGVVASMSISQEQADELLSGDLTWVEAAVNHLVVVPVSQAQFDALADFVYNEGAGALQRSTALHLLNSGAAMDKVADALLLWDKKMSGGSLVSDSGILQRRRAERALFLGV
jgi:lysozyme